MTDKAIIDLFKRAEEIFAAAFDLSKLGYYRDAMSRVYYGVFYITETLLLSENLSASSHRGTIYLFSENFVKIEKIDKKYYDLLQSSFEKRMASDYNPDFDISKEYVEDALLKGKEFLGIAKRYLGLEP